MSRIVFILFIAILCVLVIVSGCSTEPTHVTIGLVPSNNPDIMKRNFEPTRQYLEKEMRSSIKLVVADSYLDLINAMKSKRVDIAWFGAFSYIAAANEMPLEPMVIQYRSGFGLSYKSLIVARDDSGIKTIDQLKNRTLALVDKGSTSGFLIPISLFKSRNIDYTDFLQDVVFVGSHDAVLTHIVNKQVDAGAMEDITFKKMVDDGKIKQGDIHIIWQSDDIPGAPYAARADLQSSLKTSFKQAMTTMNTKEPEAMKAFDNKIEKYVEFNDSLYNGIRNLSTIMGQDFIKENFLVKNKR